ncbi:hypothetical protein EJB05_56591, partial [Eragrostis curvula]
MARPVATLIFAMVITPALAIANSPVINATCAALTPQLYEYCVGVLSADPAATNATDAHGLATAAVNITADKAAATLQVITYLISELNTCQDIYARMEEGLANVLTDIRDGRFKSAMLEMDVNVTGSPNGGCDIMLFEGNAQKDPISEENTQNDLWASLADAILETIERNVSKRGT